MSCILIKKFFRNGATMDQSFGTWLKEERKRKGFTQESLAKAAGDVCTSAYISNLERNQDIGKKGRPTRPGEEIVDALADALGVPRGLARSAAGYAAPIEAITPDDEERAKIERLYFRRRRLTKKSKEWFDRQMAMVDREIDRMELEEAEKKNQ